MPAPSNWYHNGMDMSNAYKITVYDIARYFVSCGFDAEEEGISNLKLQKLVYYAQGYHLAIFDVPFFNEPIDAWRHGPVCPDIYQKYKCYGARSITEQYDEDFTKIFTKDQLELLDEVYSVFGQFAAWKLRDMTHEEEPWKNHEALAEEIPQEEMRLYFKTRLN